MAVLSPSHYRHMILSSCGTYKAISICVETTEVIPLVVFLSRHKRNVVE